VKAQRKKARSRVKPLHRKEQTQGPLRGSPFRPARQRVGSKVHAQLLQMRNKLREQLESRIKERTHFLHLIENASTEVIQRPDGSRIKVRSIDPMTDRMDWDNERGIARVGYEIQRIDELLSPTRGRPPEPIYECALQDQQLDRNLTVADLARKYLPGYFPDRKDSAIEMIRQGLRRAKRKKIKNIP
jgi:hypothetical protein